MFYVARFVDYNFIFFVFLFLKATLLSAGKFKVVFSEDCMLTHVHNVVNIMHF